MNSYFKIPFVFLLLSFCANAFAIDIYGIYYASCQRGLGVILGIKDNNVELLGLDGEIQKIPRYDIVGLAQYPLNHMPIKQFKVNGEENYYYDIKTKYKRKIKGLVEGWPISFSKKRISFLNKKGLEISVSRSRIWEIERKKVEKNIQFSNEIKFRYRFIHPTSLRKCSLEKDFLKYKKLPKVSIDPQEFTSNAVAIKRHFDFIIHEHKKIHDYTREQKFYAVPELFKNRSTLGFWGVIGSRYGASENRSNNGLPILTNEFSSGPFGFQHIFLTGSAPNSYLVHEEPQSQMYYHFKADYFHMSFFFDPNIVLVGDKYKWDAQDVTPGTDRVVESSFVEMGLDFGHFSLLAFLVSDSHVAIHTAGELKQKSLNLDRYGVSYQNHLVRGELIYGKKTDIEGGVSVFSSYDYTTNSSVYINTPIEAYTLSLLRLNLNFNFDGPYALSYSFIKRGIEFNQSYKSRSFTNMFLLSYDINYKYLVEGMASVERYAPNPGDSKLYFKVGSSFNIIF